MEPSQPSLYQHQHLHVRVATPSHLVVDVEGAHYYVTYLPKHDNPPTGGPLRPGHRLRIYNKPYPNGPTLVERITPAGGGDGCKYLLRNYDRVAPSSSGTPTRCRARNTRGAPHGTGAPPAAKTAARRKRAAPG
jgi:hypothetical protein